MDSDSDKLDILIQCNELYPHSSGGIGMQTLNMANAMHQARHRVTIIGMYNEIKTHEHPFQFIQLRRIKNLGFLGHLINIFRFQFFLWKYIVLKKNNIDIIEYPDYEGYACFSFVNTPRVVRMNHPGFYVNGKYGGQKWWKITKCLRWLLIRRSINKADNAIAVANYLVPLIHQWSKPKKIEVIYNMTELEMTNDLVRQTNGNTGNTNDYLLNFGTMASHKGIPLLVTAYMKIADQLSYNLLLAGRIAKGQFFGTARKFISKTKKNQIIFLGEQNPEQLKSIIKKAKAVIFPSLQENMPLAWAEAMGMGKALWASNIPVASEMIQDGLDGNIFEKENIEAIENVLLKIEQINAKRLEVLSKNAQKKYKQLFSKEVLLDKNIHCFRSLIRKES